MRGAWIEIYDEISTASGLDGRSPCGERGLKFLRSRHDIRQAPGSLPMRGAWIEICYTSLNVIEPLSLPMRGAWIEIDSLLSSHMVADGRSPCGERGLKSVQYV